MSILHMAKETMTLLQSKKERDYQDDRKAKDYPKMPCGFQCFLCGRKFATDEERVQHLEKEPHGGMYDTGSPQEREDARRHRK